jgi:hypothetical protein
MIPDVDPSVLYTGGGVAVVIIGVVLTFVLRWQQQRKGETAEILTHVKDLVGALTNGKGKPSLSCGADSETVKRHEKHLTAITETLAEHGQLHKEELSSINQLRYGQKEILDFITSNSKPPEKGPPQRDSHPEPTQLQTLKPPLID